MYTAVRNVASRILRRRNRGRLAPAVAQDIATNNIKRGKTAEQCDARRVADVAFLQCRIACGDTGDFVHSSFKSIMREAYFHEDDYCQTELLPIANHKHCRDQLREIESFSAHTRQSSDGRTCMFDQMLHKHWRRLESQGLNFNETWWLCSRVPGDCRRSVAQIPPLD